MSQILKLLNDEDIVELRNEIKNLIVTQAKEDLDSNGEYLINFEHLHDLMDDITEEIVAETRDIIKNEIKKRLDIDKTIKRAWGEL